MKNNKMQNAVRVLTVVRRSYKALLPCIFRAKQQGFSSLPIKHNSLIRSHLARSLSLNRDFVDFKVLSGDTKVYALRQLARAIRAAAQTAADCARNDAERRAAQVRSLSAARRVWNFSASKDDLATLCYHSNHVFLFNAFFAAPLKVLSAIKARAEEAYSQFEAENAAFEKRDSLRRAVQSAVAYLGYLRRTEPVINALEAVEPDFEQTPKAPKPLKRLVEEEFSRRRDARAAQLAEQAAAERRQAAASARKLAAFKSFADAWVSAKRENRQAISRRRAQGLPPPRPIPGFRLLQTVKNQLKAPAKKGQKNNPRGMGAA